MTAFDIIKELGHAPQVECDSRRVTEGALFVAIKGNRDDGLRHVADAISRGACAIVAEDPAVAGTLVPWFRVEDARLELARLACAASGEPSHKLRVFAVTGTNGKTTIAGLMRDCLQDAGVSSGLLSTVENSYCGHVEEASRTTPDAPSLQRYLADMLDAGCKAVVMEASSHALDQSRVAGMRFAAAGFTNLSRDHFDYHSGFEDYFAAKSKLFRQLGIENPGAPGVVNADDEYGRRLLKLLPSWHVNAVSYSIGGKADIIAENLVLDAGGSCFTLVAKQGTAVIRSHLLGRYNVSNMLCVAGMALESGIPFDSICATLASAQPRWGRLEKVLCHNGAMVFVDYAHTPDAIEKALTALREITPKRLLIVFGCGGDRDHLKRPQMAAAAAHLADFTIITSDNPRTENPDAIIDEAMAGMPASAPHLREPDRMTAIRAALDMLSIGDCLLIAGKGHETYQEINGVKQHFDDREIVRAMHNV